MPTVAACCVSRVMSMGPKNPKTKPKPPRINAPLKTAAAMPMFFPESHRQEYQLTNTADDKDIAVLIHSSRLVVIENMVLIKNKTSKKISEMVINLSSCVIGAN